MVPFHGAPSGLALDARRGLGEAVRFGDVAAGDLLPALGHRLSAPRRRRRRPPSRRRNRARSNPGVLSSPLNSVLTPGHHAPLPLPRAPSTNRRHVARIRDQHDQAAPLHERQRRGEAEDVIHRQRRDDDLRAFDELARDPDARSARGWRACCDASASRPSRRRWCRPCIAGRRCPRARRRPPRTALPRRARAPSRKSMAPSMRQSGTIFFTCLMTKLTIQRFGTGSRSPICVVMTCSTGVLASTCLQRAGEILEDDDRLGAGVLQLVLELARRVQRIDVDHDHAGAQDAEQRDRVLQQVGRHDGDAIALRHAGQSLQDRRRNRASSRSSSA